MFPKTRSAEVPITVLLGAFPEEAPGIKTVLPGSLEELCLQWGRHGIGRQICRTAYEIVDLRSHSPTLKRIVIRQMAWFPEQREDFKKERRELQADCAVAGIDVQVVFDWLFPGLWIERD